jgi:hypothetical protein
MATIDKIAKQVASALKGAGMTNPATLIVVTPGTRAPDAASGGTNPTTENVKARGLVIAWKRQRINATDIQVGDRVVMLLGATIAGGAIPKVGDKITIEGVTSRIIDIERDAAGATYSCLTRK